MLLCTVVNRLTNPLNNGAQSHFVKGHVYYEKRKVEVVSKAVLGVSNNFDWEHWGHVDPNKLWCSFHQKY